MRILVLLVSTLISLAVAGPSPQTPGQAPPETPVLDVDATPIPPNEKGWPHLSDSAEGILDRPPTRLFLDPTCTHEQKSKLILSWNEARELGTYLVEPHQGFNNDIALKDWLGDEWNDTSSDRRRKDSKAIGQSFARLTKLFNEPMDPTTLIYWSCEDPDQKCFPGQISGKTFKDLEGTPYSIITYTTIWCPEFFNTDLLVDLLDKHKNDNRGQEIIENFAFSSAAIMLHEIFKYRGLVGHYAMSSQSNFFQGSNRADHWWQEAGDYGTRSVFMKVDPFVMSATAIVVQQHFAMPGPPAPKSIIDYKFPLPDYASVDPLLPSYTSINSQSTLPTSNPPAYTSSATSP
ncbi:hypothetical protein GLAREA_11491 [Glarea lozoyensis ATCC 20868]|uniref:Metalloproteases (Zincins), catalytic n=1 Tax=Glarea lozoyensis (strain ATCC 20868 / MF5171) TaxID=1116229 RepID=S3CG85_GLAL2|nr:uncharacterized protein GLAREA_11491 [Glarea lozoyensis ATCC 20868]EPE24910.1 hypothetical protein GLAREA_11491 [Glarea lozoyensis ATCC 20868]